MAAREHALYIEDHRRVTCQSTQTFDPEPGELPMRNSDDHQIVLAMLWERFKQIDTVLVSGLERISPGVVHIHVRAMTSRLFDQLDDACIAQIRTVFLEAQSENQHMRAGHRYSLGGHGFKQSRENMRAHAFVDLARRSNQRRCGTDLLRFMDQVIGIHTDAVPTDETGPYRHKVPFGLGRLEYRFGIDVHTVEHHRELVGKGDVDVALRVLHRLGGFGNLDAGRKVGARLDDAAIDLVDKLSRGWVL